MTKAFISYSHADSKYLERLHKHLAMIRRDGTLSAWTDNEIFPGNNIDEDVKNNLLNSSLFLALISADYLNSRYCYDIEFAKAQELENSGKLRIVPIIVEPCDWQASPFKKYLALPKDGKPISEWANQNNAFLDIITKLRSIVKGIESESSGEYESSFQKPQRRPIVKKDFDAIQKAEFQDQSYSVIERYFKESCSELNSIGGGSLKARYENMNATAFTCTVVNRERKSNSEAHITIWNSKGRGHFGDICYIDQRHAENNSSNGSIKVENDDYNMYLSFNTFHLEDGKRYSAEQAAERLWNKFVSRVGIDYE